ncbi:hypothetical protein AX16_009257 [Volvariella volvacea WC 439]|nr:hypothetical protein AX16_009257 [Volvariella volvacea WC 439]
MAPTGYERLSGEEERENNTVLFATPDSPQEANAEKPFKDPYGRPPTYYGEGPFDPPSSDEDSLLEKEGPRSPAFIEHAGLFDRQRSTPLRIFLIFIASLVAFAAFIGIIAASTYTGGVRRVHGSRHILMDHIFNGTFAAERKSLHWVPEAGDGVFSIDEDGYIRLVDLKTNRTTDLVRKNDVRDTSGQPFWWFGWRLSPDMKYLLVKTDYLKQWRWSSYGNYYIYNIEANTTHPLTPPTHPATTAYVTWAPTGQALAYVTGNDLYILPSPEPDAAPIRVTSSGNASLFHGVPDWVYEEEIFSADYALWWSPDSTKVAYLAFDETAVDEFTFPVYNPTEDSNAVIPYTSEVTMKYPKPGYNNPLVSVHVFDLAKFLSDDEFANGDLTAENATLELDWAGRQAANNSIILEVTWVANTTLLVKEVNRNADDGSVVLFNLEEGLSPSVAKLGRVVRKLGKLGEEGDEGWIDSEQTVYPLPSSVGGQPAYLDIVPNQNGYNHIALFSPVDAKTPAFLTSGEWEVTGGIKGVDMKNRIVYFEAANPSSTERHLYSVPLPDSSTFKAVDPTALTDVTKPSYYSSSFSPQAGFYVLSYNGPSIPWQKVVQANNPEFDYVLTNNDRLANITLEYEAPTVIHSTIESDGYELNVKEIRPPRMDDSGRTKYAVLFRVYGGPNSQLVDLRFNRDFHDYLACSLQYIVVVVDGRGTGFKGRKLRNPVKSNLGYWETVDQINAAKIWAAKDYVDPKRIGIWGWSYGGFMSSKVVEADAGIHSLAMAVAPVTSWRLYDSIYTERYMNLPDVNPGGYINASISNVEGFHHVDYLLAHGSADDNVHYANSAHLLDMFTKAQVRNFRFRMFTDR